MSKLSIGLVLIVMWIAITVVSLKIAYDQGRIHGLCLATKAFNPHMYDHFVNQGGCKE